MFYEALYYSACLVFQYTLVSGSSSSAPGLYFLIHVKLKGSMDLGTGYCYAGSASGSALVTHTRCLEVIILELFACLITGCLLHEGARHSSARQTIPPARYGEGAFKATTEERGATTLAHPEGPYIYTSYRFIGNSGRNQTHPENSENGSKARRFTIHSHTSNLQGRS